MVDSSYASNYELTSIFKEMFLISVSSASSTFDRSLSWERMKMVEAEPFSNPISSSRVKVHPIWRILSSVYCSICKILWVSS